MMRSPTRRKQLIENLIWLAVALMLALIVWLTASLASNPVTQRGVSERIPIDIRVSDDVIITNNPTSRAYVVVRAPETTFEELAPDDIQVFADLQDITSYGRQTITLQAAIAEQRQASVVTISPSQITVELQQRQERLVPLQLVPAGDVPASVEALPPTSNISQVLVTGPADAVSSVETAQVVVDLNDRRETFEQEIRPQLLNDEGDPVGNLTVSPDVVSVTVPIQPRSDVREVRVTPNILGEPPAGYTLSADFNYTPEKIFVTGPPDMLQNLPGTILTAPIDLSAYTDDFEIRVPVELPNDDIIPITGQRITVSIGIDPIQSSRQFEGASVEPIGLSDDFTATIAPEEVTVLISGPQLALTELTMSDIRVIVDLSNQAEAGTYQLPLVATVNVSQIESENVSVIPSTVDVQLQPITPPTQTP